MALKIMHKKLLIIKIMLFLMLTIKINYLTKLIMKIIAIIMKMDIAKHVCQAMF